MKATKKVNILVAVALVISIFLAIFFYYSPAEYVKTASGEVYLVDGEPIIYHTDIFGNTFVFDGGIRVYVAIPQYAGS